MGDQGSSRTFNEAAYRTMAVMVRAHEKYLRGESGGRRLVAKFSDWSDFIFQGRDLSNSDLSGCNLSNGKFAATKFVGASLYCCDLSGADLRGVDFRRADLRGVRLKGANLYGANLDEADFREATLVRADQKDGFRSARSMGEAAETGLRKVDFRHCSLKRAKLGDAKLQGADFSGVNLSGANLQGADLRSAAFKGAILSGVDLKGVRIDADAIKDCVLAPDEAAIKRMPELLKCLDDSETWATSEGSAGSLARIERADLRPLGLALQNRRLSMSRFIDCRMIECDFGNSTFAGAAFIDCDLRGAQFAGCDLRGARFENCLLAFSDFREAQLGAISVGREQTLGVNFSGSSTIGALFRSADQERLNLAALGPEAASST